MALVMGHWGGIVEAFTDFVAFIGALEQDVFVTFIMGVQCRPEVREQRRRETDAMVASARTRVGVSADEGLRQLGHVREEKDFSFVLHCDSFALCCINCCKKTKQFSDLKKLVVTHYKELFMRDLSRD